MRMRPSDGGLALLVLLWTLAATLPLYLAWGQLSLVSEASVFDTILNLESRFQTKGALRFTFLEAALSTLLTILLGVPLAWTLGRWRWPARRFLRAFFTAPFVMPSVVVAAGFLALVDSDGPLMVLGIDLRTETGVVGAFSSISGWSNSGQMIALLLAHAWFNLALIVRFCEPLLSSLDPSLEEAARLLPQGRSRVARLRRLWAPLLWPSVAAASVLTFIFSFTSFALVKSLTPDSRNIEVVLANQADWAGINVASLGQTPSEIVMALSLIQLVTMVAALALLSVLQARRSRTLPLLSDEAALKPAPLRTWRSVHLALMALFTLSPLLMLALASFQVRDAGAMAFSFAGWQAAFDGTGANSTLTEALANSVKYAILTMAVALPTGYGLAHTIHRLEATRPRLASLIDILAMLPLALSAVMVGLGVLIGLLRTEPDLLTRWWIPAFGHIMLTTPFVVRILLPAIRRLDPDLESASALLGAGPLRRLFSIRLPLLRGSLIVAASFVLAISLGEFGASWVVVRFGEWSTLPVLIGERLARPGWNPLMRPAAYASSTALLFVTMALFMAVERFRPDGARGEF